MACVTMLLSFVFWRYLPSFFPSYVLYLLCCLLLEGFMICDANLYPLLNSALPPAYCAYTCSRCNETNCSRFCFYVITLFHIFIIDLQANHDKKESDTSGLTTM